MNTYDRLGRCARIGDTILNKVAVLLAVLILFLGGFAIWDNYIANHTALSQDTMKYKPIDDSKSFAELLALNPDVCAWLTVDKTHIDYPVVKGKTDLEYLNKDVYGNFALGGSIFLDSQNAKEMTDQYVLLYGHHMANGGMFGDVVHFTKKKYFKSHKTGTLVLPNKRYHIKIFACITVPASDAMIYNTSGQSPAHIAEILAHVKEKAVQYRDIGVTNQDKIIAMSTCAEAETNERVVIFGKLIEDKK